MQTAGRFDSLIAEQLHLVVLHQAALKVLLADAVALEIRPHLADVLRASLHLRIAFQARSTRSVTDHSPATAGGKSCSQFHHYCTMAVMAAKAVVGLRLPKHSPGSSWGRSSSWAC